MGNNIGIYDRVIRGVIGVALLLYAWQTHSLLALGFAVFTFYEALSSWCAFYALIGKNTCPISHNTNETKGMIMLNARKLGLSAGIIWGATMFLMTILSIYTAYGTQWLHLMMDIYPGYTISWEGSIMGLLYGFLDGFVGCFLLGWLYNKLN